MGHQLIIDHERKSGADRGMSQCTNGGMNKQRNESGSDDK
jgi:hypothetical protein